MIRLRDINRIWREKDRSDETTQERVALIKRQLPMQELDEEETAAFDELMQHHQED